MPTRVLLEGPAIEPLLAQVREEYGSGVRIISADKVRSGGFGGFFAKQHYELSVEVPDENDDRTDMPRNRPAADSAPQTLEQLLARAEARDDISRPADDDGAVPERRAGRHAGMADAEAATGGAARPGLLSTSNAFAELMAGLDNANAAAAASGAPSRKPASRAVPPDEPDGDAKADGSQVRPFRPAAATGSPVNGSTAKPLPPVPSLAELMGGLGLGEGGQLTAPTDTPPVRPLRAAEAYGVSAGHLSRELNGRSTTSMPSSPGFAAPVSASPFSAAPVSASSFSANPVSANPVSANPVSASPFSAAPVSGSPFSASPASTNPASASPASASPASTNPVSAGPASARPAGRGPAPQATPGLSQSMLNQAALHQAALHQAAQQAMPNQAPVEAAPPASARPPAPPESRTSPPAPALPYLLDEPVRHIGPPQTEPADAGPADAGPEDAGPAHTGPAHAAEPVAASEPGFAAAPIFETTSSSLEHPPASTQPTPAERLAALTTPLPADPVVANLMRVGMPAELAAMITGGDTYSGVLTALASRPAAPAIPDGPGEILVLVGELAHALASARHCLEQIGLDQTHLLLAGPSAAGTGIHSSKVVPGPEDAARRTEKLHTADSAWVVAMDAPVGATDSDWVLQTCEAIGATAVWAVVDATRKTADTARHLKLLGDVEALVVHGVENTSDPATVLGLDHPIVSLDGRPATPHAWAAMLCARIATDIAPIPAPPVLRRPNRSS